MTCQDTRAYLFAFLDNELDAATSLEVQQHLEHCAACARESEIERTVRHELERKLQADVEAPDFDEEGLVRLLRRERGESRTAPSGLRGRWRRILSGSLAAVLLVIVGVFVQRTTSSAPRTRPLDDLLVEDFEHFVTKNKPLGVVSGDAAEVAAWLRDRTALGVNVPTIDPQVGTLLGGRKCKIDGEPAAFAVYRIGDSLASFVAVRGPDEALASLKPIERNGRVHWIGHRRGHAIVACRRDGLVYAAVSRLPEDTLLKLFSRM